MTMHINLSPEMEGFIKAKVATGFYGNATEVVRDAIRRMQSDEVRLMAWNAAVKLGSDQLDRDEGVSYTADVLSSITDDAIRAMRSGTATDPDVLP